MPNVNICVCVCLSECVCVPLSLSLSLSLCLQENKRVWMYTCSLVCACICLWALIDSGQTFPSTVPEMSTSGGIAAMSHGYSPDIAWEDAKVCFFVLWFMCVCLLPCLLCVCVSVCTMCMCVCVRVCVLFFQVGLTVYTTDIITIICKRLPTH